MIVLYAVTLFLPGTLLGALAGLRGWTLAGVAPLLTYGVAGVAGPLSFALGQKWSAAAFAIATILAGAIAAVVRLLVRRKWPKPDPRQTGPDWSLLAHAGVAVALLVATGVGIAAILGGIRSLSAIPQDWDAVFHAGGIRYIAETGDGSLFGMPKVNWFEGNAHLYYPNAYHLVAAAVYQMSGAAIPTVLNAHTVLIPGMAALSLVAMVHRFGGRAVLAGASALAVVAITPVYDLLWRGPLLPFATGVALTPLVAVLVRELLDAPGLRAAIGPGVAFVGGLAGYLCVHPAILVGAVVFVLPMLAQRWWGHWRQVPRELGLLVAGGVLAAAVCGIEVAGALSTGGNTEKLDRVLETNVAGAVGQLVMFGHGIDSVQLRLAAVMALGLIGAAQLRGLRWLIGTAVLFGGLFVLTAAYSDPLARIISSIWWDDSWRLVGLAALPMAVLIGNGVAEVQRLLARTIGRRSAVMSLATAAAVLLVFALGTRNLYLERDQIRMTQNTGDGPAVSQLEIEGMEAIAKIVPPGARVLNDRGDGSAWMYALTGVKPVAGHYDDLKIGPNATLLAARFNKYLSEPAVRAAVAALDIHYVQLDRGFLRSWAARQPGLTDLAGQPWLQVVYSNPDVVLYKIEPGRTGSFNGPVAQ
ncbi:MAG: hypothetical protein QOI16_675 [Pseudonocardiales bacterium]|nr:hypothetical protein [Pseudonocardiales bacterium]